MSTAPTPDELPATDPLQGYRQPLVTATGILLGFILNFMASWVKSESELGDRIATMVVFCLVIGIIGLIVVLYRTLLATYPRDLAGRWHQTTLLIFISSVVVAFIGVFLDSFALFLAG